MRLTAAGTQAGIQWPGVNGTISISKVDALDTGRGGVGDWNGATVVFEVAYTGGDEFEDPFRPAEKDGVQIVFEEGSIESQNFSSAACTIRAIMTGTPSGSGIELGINAR